MHPAIAVLMGIGIGAAVGALNASLVEGLRISPVIVTLGTMIMVRGLSLVALGRYNSWLEIKGPVFDDLARRTITGIPLDALVAILSATLLLLALRFTTMGRRLHAVGDAPVASRLAGLSVDWLRASAYVGCGAFAGAAGVLVAARTGLISPSIGAGLEFFAIAVVALGAGGLPAGRVRVGQTVVGVLILMMVFNYMTIRGVPGTWQTTATGLLLLAAMVGGRVLQRGEGADVALGEAFRDEFARLSRAGAALVHGALGAATLLLALVFALINPKFLTVPNLIALVEQNAALAIVAVGAMIGIVSRVIDISPGSVLVLGAVSAALAATHGVPVPVALLAGVATCVGAYVLNGAIVGGLGLDPLIVTLAAWIWARGLAVSLTNASTIAFPMSFVTVMNTPVALGFTPAVVFVALAFLAGWLILSRLPIGMRIYALGGDPRMLRQAGVSDKRLRFIVLVIMSLFTSAGMIVMLGRLGAAAPTAGFGLELDAIVAVIIGGASFRGGTGRLRDTAVGVLFLAILNNGLSGLQMGDAQFFLIKGAAILLALTLRALVQRVLARSTVRP
jgi:ribose transport system permease protein